MTADEQGYNGWTNYETWCVNLWLSNDKGLYNEVRELAGTFAQSGDEHARYRFADELKTFVGGLPECAEVQEKSSFVSDLLGAALSEVDWAEIANNWFDDASEDSA